MEISSPAVSNYFSAISSWTSVTFGPSLGPPVALLVSLVAFFIAVALIFSIASYLMGWMERKVIARAQSRRGPTYVGKFGILQNFADLIKLVSKEWITPTLADKPLFSLVLPVVVASMILLFTFIPLTPSFLGINTTLGLFAIFVVISFYPLLLFFAGWTSGNKFASISAQRSIVMMVSYEIPLFLVIVAVSMLSGGFGMVNIVNSQSSFWFAVKMPIGFLVFFIVMLAELERTPFDLREADNELVAGWLTDVSPPYYALALLLDYMRLCLGSLLITVIFLGGWLGPSFLPPFVWTMIKLVVVGLVIILVRVTVFRMRVDRMLRSGWMYLIPLSVFNLLLTFIIFVR
ncbi:MAG: NADH-quinone oxidoreductase subunit H [Candidatus Micrarchaeota archaeon]|nr:NADH-quinone oxidoreductase subunit H [Candidatus Micrarchaeota archaeon]